MASDQDYGRLTVAVRGAATGSSMIAIEYKNDAAKTKLLPALATSHVLWNLHSRECFQSALRWVFLRRSFLRCSPVL